jgi:hypothetical protein
MTKTFRQDLVIIFSQKKKSPLQNSSHWIKILYLFIQIQFIIKLLKQIMMVKKIRQM